MTTQTNIDAAFQNVAATLNDTVGKAIPVTQTSFAGMVTNNELVPGRSYFVTDSTPKKYFDALSTNSYSERASSSGVEEAPQDGSSYVRQDASWTKLPKIPNEALPWFTKRSAPIFRTALKRVASQKEDPVTYRKDCRILMIGDSTTSGMGAGTNPQGYVAARMKNICYFLSKAATAGIASATDNNFFGNSNCPIAFSSYDPRVTLEGFVPDTSSTNYSTIGGYLFRASAVRSRLIFTPENPFNRVVVWSLANTVRSWCVSVDGVVVSTVNNTTVSGTTIVPYSFDCPIGSRSVTIEHLSGATGVIVGIETYNKFQIGILQASVHGATLDTFNLTGSYGWHSGSTYPQLAADLAIINLTITDAMTASDGTYETRLRDLCQRISSAGTDILLVKGLPANYSAVHQASADTIYTIIDTVAEDLNLSVIDLPKFFGNFTNADTFYGMYDMYQGTEVLYNAVGNIIGLALVSLSEWSFLGNELAALRKAIENGEITNDHARLSHLVFSESGHTGFASEEDVAAAEVLDATPSTALTVAQANPGKKVAVWFGAVP